MDRAGYRRFFIAAAFLVPVLLMAGCWAFLTVDVPYWDDYSFFIRYLSEPWPARWSRLFAFHNEHRIATARLLADALVALGGGAFSFRAMMAVGNLVQLAYAAGWAWLLSRRCRLGVAAAVPVFWLLTSFIHYENSCWALTSVSNVPVVALAFAACLAFARRERAGMFALALLCATAATFTTGGGMTVWPCLAAMELSEPLHRAGSWRTGTRALADHLRTAAPRLAALALVAAAVAGCYFHGFPVGGGAAAPAGPAARLANGALFFVAFLGGMVPVYPVALALGAVVLALVAVVVVRYPRLRSPAVFWFMAAEIGTMLSAALFRSADPHVAVSSRYCIVSCSVFACVLHLLPEACSLPLRLETWAVRALGAAAICYSLAFLALGAPQFARRNELMRRNILTWPEYVEGLRTPMPAEDGEYLRRCVERGVYDPGGVRRPGETPPPRPLPWLR